MATATLRIRGTDLRVCTLEPAGATSTETDIKDLVDTITITKTIGTQPDTRIGDRANRVRLLKPTFSATISFHPDQSLVGVIGNDAAAEQKARGFTFEVGTGATGTNGYKVTAEVYIVPDSIVTVNGDGDAPPISVTLENADGAAWTWEDTIAA